MLAVQVKARSTTPSNAAKGQFIANVAAGTFAPRTDLRLLLVLADTGQTPVNPDGSCLASMSRKMTKPNGHGRHRFAASPTRIRKTAGLRIASRVGPRDPFLERAGRASNLKFAWSLA